MLTENQPTENNQSLAGAVDRQANQRELRGVRGWLLFLAVYLFVFLPYECAIAIFGLLAGASTDDYAAGVVGAIIVGAIGALSMYAGLRLYWERSNALRWVRIALYVLGAFSLVDLISVEGPGIKGRTAPIVSVIAIIAWLIYLRRSERVRLTFSNSEDVAAKFR